MANLKEIETDSEKKCAVCKAAAPQTCSACKMVSYCSKEHQKQHWKQHKLVCKSFEVKSNDVLGRYLIASRDMEVNDKVVTELPLVMGPKLVEPTPVCLGCYQLPTPGVRCPRCFWPICNPQCPGLTDVHHHAVECYILSLHNSLVLQPDGLRYNIISPLRCLILQKRNPKKWHQVITMEAHSNSRGHTTEIYKEMDDNVVNYLIDSYLSKLDEGLNYSNEIIHRICGILDVNALEVRVGGNVELLALFPTICIMEHECRPNTMYFYDHSSEHKITLLLTMNLKKGQHMSTSYTHVLWGTQERRDHLKQNKYFACCCERCSDPTEFGTYISALKCLGLTQDNSCEGYQLPVSPLDDLSEWKCNKCPVTLKSNEVRNLISVLTTEVETLQQQVHPSVAKVIDVQSKLERFLHPHHYLCYETKHLFIQLYGHESGYLHHELTVEQLQKKEEICRDLLGVNKVLDPGYSRLSLYTAVLMYELHSALLELKSRRIIDCNAANVEAKSLLQQAIHILQHEPINSAGSNMTVLIKKSLHQLEKPLKENAL